MSVPIASRGHNAVKRWTHTCIACISKNSYFARWLNSTCCVHALPVRNWNCVACHRVTNPQNGHAEPVVHIKPVDRDWNQSSSREAISPIYGAWTQSLGWHFIMCWMKKNQVWLQIFWTKIKKEHPRIKAYRETSSIIVSLVDNRPAWSWHPQCRGALSHCHEVGV